ncbi:MAG: SDR family oxidoreductase [Proteobacteria bacterium]|nr:SDR family oxidoreductase [Pseudomonadota bacterium]
MKIRGTDAIITGASSGLGRATALKLAKRGANLALVARRRDKLEQVAAEARKFGVKVLVVPADISKEVQVKQAFRKIAQKMGEPDILVNAAGLGIWKAFIETSGDEHRHMMEVNYWGAFYWIRQTLPGMAARSRDSIVNISSAMGKVGLDVTAGYSASKFALTGLSESLHREYSRLGVTVSALHPGSFKTDFWNEENIPSAGLPPLIRYAPKLSVDAVARNIIYSIRLNLPVRTLPFYVGFLTRINGLWFGLASLLLWKGFSRKQNLKVAGAWKRI